MSLTVPQAGFSAGRAAQLANVPQPQNQSGAILAEFGERMAQAGFALERDRLDTEMTRLQTGMTRDLGTLRLRVEEMGDPTAAGTAWDQGTAQLREQYLSGADANGRPTVDPKLREDFGLAFDDLTMTHGLAIGGRLMQLRQSQRMAQYYDYSNAVVAQAATTDPATRARLFANLDGNIDARVARGDMTAEEGAVAKRAGRQSAENTTAITLMDRDPAGLASMLDGGGLASLDPETRARYRAAAQGEVERQAVAAQKAAAQQQAEVATAWGQRLDDIVGIAGSGQKSVDEVWLHSQPVADLAARDPDFARKYGKTMAWIALRDERPGISLATPAELNAAIEEERARPKAAPWDAERLPLLEAQRDKAIEGWRRDPMDFARKSGMSVPALDLANLDAVPAAIAQRVTFAGVLTAQGYTAEAAPLDKDEQTRLTTAISGVQNPERRATLVGEIASAVIGRGGDPDDIDALAKDPVQHWVALSGANGAFGVALGGEILRGQEAIDAKTVKLPSVDDRMGPTFDMLSDMFAGIDGGEAHQAQVIAAADALYAARVRGSDPGDGINETTYAQALHEVLGGSGAYGTARQRGGVQEVNGRRTFLPDGVRARDVTEALDGIAADLQPGRVAYGVAGRRNRPPQADRAERVLHSIAAGARPAVNGRPLSADEWRGASIAQVGPDEYALLLDFGGGMQAQTMDGAPFTFSLNRLLSGYAGGAR